MREEQRKERSEVLINKRSALGLTVYVVWGMK
jgi:hypothetical protein